MRRILKAIRGLGVLSVVLGLFDVVLGFPGYLNDINTWQDWFGVDIGDIWATIIVAGAAVAVMALATPDIWVPFLRRRFRRIAAATALVPTNSQSFVELIDRIERVEKLVHNEAAYPAQMSSLLRSVLTLYGRKPILDAQAITLREELRYLSQELQSVGIRHPPAEAVHDWVAYLAYLKARLRNGDLMGARRLIPGRNTLSI